VPKFTGISDLLKRQLPGRYLAMALFVSAVMLGGCASTSALFFYPQKIWISTPEDFQLDYDDVMLKAHDGTTLHSWWIPAQGDIADSGTMVLYLHGNAENISSHSRGIYWLAESGISVLALDYRGFGASEGHPVMPDILQDIEAAAAWMREQYPDRRLVVLGQSIGAALSIDFVARAQDRYRIDALFAEAPFTGFPAVARSALSHNILGWIVWPFTVLVPDDWDPEDGVGKIHIPVMIMSSPDDQVVPHNQSKKLYEILTQRSGSSPSCWAVSHGRHITSFADEQLRKQALEFILSGRCPAFTVP